MRWAVLLVLLPACNFFRETCDPTTYENRCVDARTVHNCTLAKNMQSFGMNPISPYWAPLDAPCTAPNTCAMIEGYAECVVAPVAKCDGYGADRDARRCVEGREQRCDYLSFWRADEDYPYPTYWVDFGPCETSSAATIR